MENSCLRETTRPWRPCQKLRAGTPAATSITAARLQRFKSRARDKVDVLQLDFNTISGQTAQMSIVFVIAGPTSLWPRHAAKPTLTPGWMWSLSDTPRASALGEQTKKLTTKRSKPRVRDRYSYFLVHVQCVKLGRKSPCLTR